MNLDATLRTIPGLSAGERTAITRGVARLDERQADWYQHIALDRLDMGSGFRCVLGQLYGEYDRGKQELGIGHHGGEYGFDAHFTEAEPTYYQAEVAYSRLDAAWSAIITARRNEAAVGGSRCE